MHKIVKKLRNNKMCQTYVLDSHRIETDAILDIYRSYHIVYIKVDIIHIQFNETDVYV